MSFPKKGKSFPKRAGAKSSGADGGGSNFALEIASALQRTLQDRNTRIKTVAGWTGANERTVKNRLSGLSGPCGAHLVVLAQHSDEVLNAVLSMAGRHDLLVGQKVADLDRRIVELSLILRELNYQGGAEAPLRPPRPSKGLGAPGQGCWCALERCSAILCGVLRQHPTHHGGLRGEPCAR